MCSAPYLWFPSLPPCKPHSCISFQNSLPPIHMLIFLDCIFVGTIPTSRTAGSRHSGIWPTLICRVISASLTPAHHGSDSSPRLPSVWVWPCFVPIASGQTLADFCHQHRSAQVSVGQELCFNEKLPWFQEAKDGDLPPYTASAPTRSHF